MLKCVLVVVVCCHVFLCWCYVEVCSCGGVADMCSCGGVVVKCVLVVVLC